MQLRLRNYASLSPAQCKKFFVINLFLASDKYFLANLLFIRILFPVTSPSIAFFLFEQHNQRQTKRKKEQLKKTLDSKKSLYPWTEACFLHLWI
jgi:hypothetical protein